MSVKKSVRQYLTFTKKERTGIFVLLVITGLIFILPMFLPFLLKPDQSLNMTITKEERSALLHKDSSSKEQSYYQKQNPSFTEDPEINGRLFYFNPNTASASEWRELGLRDKTIATILNYLSKGGTFRRAEDLQKIYGMRPQDYERLMPYVKIEGGKQPPHAYPANNAYPSYPPNRQPQHNSWPADNNNRSVNNTPVNINSADTTAFIRLPGIGSKLASRIVLFREKLGGFYSVDQVAETFGLKDSVFQQIKPLLMPDLSAIRKININTAGLDLLKNHPYIKFTIANAMVQYRTQHGDFKSLTDLKRIVAISEDLYRKLEPYLSLY
jgi:competence protein ComEA